MASHDERRGDRDAPQDGPGDESIDKRSGAGDALHIFNRWVSEMREEMVEPRHKMLQEHPDIINRSAIEPFCKMREAMVEMRHKMLRAYPDIFKRSDKTEMKDEVIKMRQKMLQEHSDIINRSAIEPFCKVRVEMVDYVNSVLAMVGFVLHFH